MFLTVLLRRLIFSIKYRTFESIACDSTNSLIACGRTVISPIPKRCPHQGAPLKNSYVKGDHLVCYWHGCLFNLKEGKWAFERCASSKKLAKNINKENH